MRLAALATKQHSVPSKEQFRQQTKKILNAFDRTNWVLVHVENPKDLNGGEREKQEMESIQTLKDEKLETTIADVYHALTCLSKT